MFCSLASARIARVSSSVSRNAANWSSRLLMLLASMTVANTGKPFLVLSEASKLLRYTPITSISSPGRAESIRSRSRITSFWRGRRPAGTVPGLSCSVSFW